MSNISEIRINKLTVDIACGTSYNELFATVYTFDGQSCNCVEWSSNAPDIASINPTTGIVFGNAVGTATIRATACDDNNIYVECNVIVHSPIYVSTANNSNLSIYATSSDTSNVIGYFAHGTALALLNDTPQNTKWFRVGGASINGTYVSGWCNGEFLEEKKTFIKYVTTTGSTYVRSYSSTSIDDNVVGEISCGMQVELIKENAAYNDGYHWHKIIYNDELAYIANFPERYEKVTRFVPLRYECTVISDDRYLTDTEKKSNAKIIYNYLKYKGWSKNAICGAIANMDAESSLSPGRHEIEDHDNDGDKAYGLLQWDPPTKWTNYALEHDYELDNIYRQLDYLIYSTRYGGGEWIIRGIDEPYNLYVYEYIYSNLSARELAIAFFLCYERSKNTGEDARNSRGDLAETWKNYFDSIGW